MMDIYSQPASQLYVHSHRPDVSKPLYILSTLLSKSCDFTKSCFFLLVAETVVLTLTKNRMSRKEGMQWFAAFL